MIAAAQHTHDVIVEVGRIVARVTVHDTKPCVWCASTAEDRARVTFVGIANDEPSGHVRDELGRLVHLERCGLPSEDPTDPGAACTHPAGHAGWHVRASEAG